MGYSPEKHYTMMKHHVVAAKRANVKHFIIDQNKIMILRIAGGAHAEMEAWLVDHGAVPDEDSYSYFREFTTTEDQQVLFLLRWG